MAPPSLSLLDLPNCLIVELFSYLDATTLFILSKTCARFCDLIENHSSLWRLIDARRAPQSEKKIGYCTERAHNDTRKVLTRGGDYELLLDHDRFFKKMRLIKNLRILALEHQRIDGARYRVKIFPPTLHELSLRKSDVINKRDFFRQSNHQMAELRVLMLDECDWVEANVFMPVAKYQKLEIFSVYKCKNLENSIPYMSVSGLYGFNSLKILDARLTPLGNILMNSFRRSRSLLALYFQNEDASYKLDYFKRKLEIAKGAPVRDFYTGDTEFDCPDECVNSNKLPSLDDRGLIEYLTLATLRTDTPLPQSYLYLDPYRSCTCGYEKRDRNATKTDNKVSNDDSDDDDSNDDDKGDDSAIRLIEKEISKLNRIIYGNDGSRSIRNNNIQLADVDLNRHNTFLVNIFQTNRENHPVYPRQRPHPNSDDDNFDRSPPTKRPKLVHSNIDELVDAEAGPSGVNHLRLELEPIGPPVNDVEVEFNDVPINIPPSPPPFEALNVRLERLNERQKEEPIPLRRLSLRGYKQITKRALHFLKDMDFEVLDFTYTEVTEKFINYYLDLHPDCRIVHEKFCVCPTNLHF